MKKVVAIFCVAAGILGVITGLILNIKRQMQISIIGGADGPTSVFLAGKLGSGVGIIIAVAVAAAGIGLLWLLYRRRKK